MILIWLPNEKYRLGQAVMTGHTNNIFSIKVNPTNPHEVGSLASAYGPGTDVNGTHICGPDHLICVLSLGLTLTHISLSHTPMHTGLLMFS